KHLRHMAITEEVFIHEQDVRQFLEEKGITELGRGGEGAVYFLRGHVVKVVNSDCAPAALREICHMLHLNRNLRGGTMGERARQDWPALLWVYVLSDGSLSIGMKPFDINESHPPGCTLYERLTFGPMMERIHLLSSIRAIANSLLYCERQGIIHHDLKPANIYIPGNPHQAPVVFDLGQALWRQSAWGRMWLRHEHNLHYWYNGTYRYMHRSRRLAHLGAVNAALRQAATDKQKHALASYVPTFYDDVFAFARILRDTVSSKKTYLHPKDKLALRDFYHKIMGLQRRRGVASGREESGLFKRLTSMFQHPPQVQPATTILPEQRWGSMEHVLPELDKTLATIVPLAELEFVRQK
ncbi:MAG TPA: serine/threonine-protein kinase, partial [Planctomycetota bacterium]|nr:serine/threonine-protein kinase [Planctomycetota bacterium]